MCPALELDRIITYIVGKKGGKYPREQMLAAATTLQANLKTVFNMFGISAPSEQFQVAAVEAMQEEYTVTNGLTKWPCQSFRDPKLEGLSIPSTVVAANCSALFTLCSVKYDQRGG